MFGSDGALYMWGYNVYGQLGNGNAANSYTPFLLSVGGKSVATIALGYYHSGAVTAGVVPIPVIGNAHFPADH